MLTRIAGSTDRPEADDTGYTLIEIVVAMVVLGLMVSAVAGLVLGTLGVVRDNSNRVTAANLATKQIESARSQLAIDIPDGSQVRFEPVAGTTYRVEQNANYAVSGSATSACAGSGDELAYKLVTVTVTWPNMGKVKPVRSDTLRALGIGAEGLDPTLGALAVGVFGATGSPIAGVSVNLSPGNIARVTGPDGCVVFAGLAQGNYTASVNQVGFVGPANARTSAVVAGALAGQVARAELLYDTKRSLVLARTIPLGHVPPTVALPLRFRNSYYDAGSALPSCATAPAGQGCVTGAPGTASYLFPATYEFWFGSCKDARSSAANVDLTVSDGSVAVPLAGIRVWTVDKDGVRVTNREVRARHANEADAAGCPAGETWTLPSTTSVGSLGGLPFGTWTISSPGGGNFRTQTVTLAPGGGVVDVTLVGR